LTPDEDTDVSIASMAKDIEYIRLKITDHCNDMRDIKTEQKNTNIRVSSLENFKSQATAIGCLIILIIGWIISLLKVL